MAPAKEEQTNDLPLHLKQPRLREHCLSGRYCRVRQVGKVRCSAIGWEKRIRVRSISAVMGIQGVSACVRGMIIELEVGRVADGAFEWSTSRAERETRRGCQLPPQRHHQHFVKPPQSTPNPQKSAARDPPGNQPQHLPTSLYNLDWRLFCDFFVAPPLSLPRDGSARLGHSSSTTDRDDFLASSEAPLCPLSLSQGRCLLRPLRFSCRRLTLLEPSLCDVLSSWT